MGNLCSLSCIRPKEEIRKNVVIRIPMTVEEPEDIVIEILQWLPTKSLMRFRCVSKSWYNLIKSPIFIKNHFLKRRKYSTLLSVPQKVQQDRLALCFTDPISPDRKDIAPEFSIPKLKSLCNLAYDANEVEVIGIRNGLVCLGVGPDYAECKTLLLCNPALMEVKLLSPCPAIIFPHKDYMHWIRAAGFGSTSANDFKIVLIKTMWAWYSNASHWVLHLYSSSSNSWKQIDYNFHAIPARNDHFSYSPFIHGACHWHAQDYEYLVGRLSFFMISLDIETEIFKKIEYPKGLSFSDMTLAVFNDCLAVVGWNEIWVMKEYGVRESWMKVINISRSMFVRPLLPWKNDKLILAKTESSSGKLAAIALDSNRTLIFDDISGAENMFWPYEESLISVNQHFSQ